MAKKKGDSGEQQQLPTMENVRHPRVHPKATRYAKLRDERIAAGKEEKEAKDELIDVMLEEGMHFYEYKDVRVDLTNKKDVKVKINGKEPSGDGEADE